MKPSEHDATPKYSRRVREPHKTTGMGQIVIPLGQHLALFAACHDGQIPLDVAVRVNPNGDLIVTVRDGRRSGGGKIVAQTSILRNCHPTNPYSVVYSGETA